jgi:hypothetical protein
MEKINPKITPFEYQLEILKIELNQIDSAIRQMDDITKSIKDWAIVTWTFSVGVALNMEGTGTIIALTAIIPVLFWIVDARYRKIQRSFIYRLNLISDFLNNEKLLKQSFEKQRLIDFTLLDPRAKKTHGENYNSYICIFKTLGFGSVGNLYIGLIIISLLLYFMKTMFKILEKT